MKIYLLHGGAVGCVASQQKGPNQNLHVLSVYLSVFSLDWFIFPQAKTHARWSVAGKMLTAVRYSTRPQTFKLHFRRLVGVTVT